MEGKFYAHYKGKHYYVLGLSTHTETVEEMVHYISLYSTDEFGICKVWCRPLRMWNKQVQISGNCPEQLPRSVPRFAEIQPTSYEIYLVREFLGRRSAH